MTKSAIARTVTVSLGIIAVLSGIWGTLTYGGLCSLDLLLIYIKDRLGFILRYFDLWRATIAVACPLGFLERSLAAREWVPSYAFPVVVVLLSVILLGRVFCGWLCPTVLLRRVWEKGRPKPKSRAAHPPRWTAYSSYVVLGGVLLASFLLRFPVFCLFCPIGLFFGAAYAVIKLFAAELVSVELFLFPAMLVLELWVLKNWCRSICPLGALLSIFGNLNRFFVPVLHKDKCLTSRGTNCGACSRVCPEGIDLNDGARFHPNSCTKCLACYERCPAKAISFPLWAPNLGSVRKHTDPAGDPHHPAT